MHPVAHTITLLKQAQASAPAVFSTSLGLEDMVLIDLIVKHAPSIQPFTLDTGRLHPETLTLLAATEAHYNKRIAVYVPQTHALEHYVRLNGINGFYDSVAQRQDCCAVRKVEPLSRALAGQRAWVTGLRREQAASRAHLSEVSFDAQHHLTKFNPLLEWTLADIEAYIREHKVPVNPLHAQGFPSIGCAPCSRALAPGEDVRAGRWWWEPADKKECGLHVRAAPPAGAAAAAAAAAGAAGAADAAAAAGAADTAGTVTTSASPAPTPSLEQEPA